MGNFDNRRNDRSRSSSSNPGSRDRDNRFSDGRNDDGRSNDSRGRDNRFRDRRNSGFNRGSRDNFRPKEMHKAVCDECKKDCEVPFKPTEGKPVYCRDCFTKRNPRF